MEEEGWWGGKSSGAVSIRGERSEGGFMWKGVREGLMEGVRGGKVKGRGERNGTVPQSFQAERFHNRVGERRQSIPYIPVTLNVHTMD